MAGPYDYTVNIPQPPAQNFLQGLTGIMQIRQMQDQSAIQQQQAAIAQQNAAFQQQMQPLEMARIKAATDASNAAASGQGIQNKLNQLTLDQRNQVGAAINAFNKDPKTGAVELAKVAPYMDANTRDGISRSIPFYVGEQINDAIASGEEFTLEKYQKFSNALTLLPTAEQQQARNAILSMPQNLQTFTKSGVIGITNAALNDNRDAAVAASDEAAKALYNSNHPAARVTAGLFDKLTNQLKDENVDLRKVPISALNISSLIQDKAFQTSLIDTLKESEAIQKASTEKPLPSSVIKTNEKLTEAAKGFETSSTELKNAADALKQFYAGGTPESGPLYSAKVKAKNFLSIIFGQQQEIPIRNELQRVINLGGLGAEAQAQGAGIKSNAMMNMATKYIPDVWNNPDAAIEKAMVTAEVKDRLAKINRAEAEWNSQFRSKQNASENADIAGVSVSKGQSKSKFINAVTTNLFPVDEVTNTPALNAIIGAKTPAKPATLPPSKQTPAPAPTAPAGGVFTIDGVEMKIVPRKK